MSAVGVFDPNKENVLEIPLRLLFIKFAVACDDDENNDDVAVEELVVVVGAAGKKFNCESLVSGRLWCMEVILTF